MLHHESKPTQYTPYSGFTLLEVLIALAIFSISAASLILTDGQTIKHVTHTQSKIIGSWVAEKSMNEMYVKNTPITLGTTESTSSVLGRTWLVQKQITKDFNGLVFRVRLYVYENNKTPENLVYQMTGFIRSPAT